MICVRARTVRLAQLYATGLRAPRRKAAEADACVLVATKMS
jgi:hypothetical protein